MRHFLLPFALLLSVSLAAQVPSYVPTDGLVAWYPFNGNANDESGNGNNGSVSGASITSDRNGNQSAFHFNGNGNQVNIPYSSSLSPTEEVSVAAWCRAETFEGKNLVSNGTHVNFYHRSYYLFGPDANGQCRFRLHAGTTEESIFTTTSFDLSEWVHVVGTYDGHSMRTYANGVLEGELLKSGAINQHGNGTTIGSNIFYAYSDYWFQGDIDDVGIWNRALTATEVQALYLSTPPQNGCTDASACNYDSEANLDDGSCIPSGCMEEEACNYDAAAECEGEACDYSCCPGPGCCGAGTHWDANLATCVVDVPDSVDAACTLMNLQELASGYAALVEQNVALDSLLSACEGEGTANASGPCCRPRSSSPTTATITPSSRSATNAGLQRIRRSFRRGHCPVEFSGTGLQCTAPNGVPLRQVHLDRLLRYLTICMRSCRSWAFAPGWTCRHEVIRRPWRSPRCSSILCRAERRPQGSWSK